MNERFILSYFIELLRCLFDCVVFSDCFVCLMDLMFFLGRHFMALLMTSFMVRSKANIHIVDYKVFPLHNRSISQSPEGNGTLEVA